MATITIIHETHNDGQFTDGDLTVESFNWKPGDEAVFECVVIDKNSFIRERHTLNKDESNYICKNVHRHDWPNATARFNAYATLYHSMIK